MLTSPLVHTEASFGFGTGLGSRYPRELGLGLREGAARATAPERFTAPDLLVPLDRLTPGERRVCKLATEGLSNRAIAEVLVVTVKAVEKHLTRAYAKLGVPGRSGLPAALDA